MDSKESEFFEKLMGTFREEAAEHIKALSDGLLSLEKKLPKDEQKKVVEAIFRETHSLKGAARSVNQQGILEICQTLESIFFLWKQDKIEVSSDSFDVLHNAIDTIVKALATPLDFSVVDQTVGQLKILMEKVSSSTPEESKVSSEASLQEGPKMEPKFQKNVDSKTQGKTIRVSIEKMNQLFQEVEETLMIKLFFKQQYNDLKKLREEDLPKDSFNKLLKNTEMNTHMVGTTIDALLEGIKKILMQPMSTLFETLPHMIRDISRTLGKEINVEFAGGEIEIDRRVLEEIKDPIIHLIRNAIDHGIESKEERVKQNKTPAGTIRVMATESDGNKVKLSLSDDGRGINTEKLKQTALKKGFISQEELSEMSDEEAIKLAFHADVSTSPIITELSGRGLGLGIVSEKVEKLGGKIEINTLLGKGTTFTLTLPLTLATSRGIFISVAGQDFILPTHYVKRVVRIKSTDVKRAENRETIVLDGHSYSFVYLANLLGIKIKEKSNTDDSLVALIVKSAEQTIVFGVDNVLSEHEILVKGLAKQHMRVKNIMAATVLETGRVILILNPVDLIKSSIKGVAGTPSSMKSKAGVNSKKSILVVEDTITTRLLIKNILTSEDYKVTTAVDGAEGFEKFQNQTFDLLITDVEMPRMNGFELTEKVRGMKEKNDIPIIICTALGSREDRERGIDLGANAYLDKSSFDNQSFISVVKKLI